MTDDLVKRLRERGTYNEMFDNADWDSTAHRIKALTAERDNLRDYIDRYSYADIAAEVARAEKAEADNARLRAAFRVNMLRFVPGVTHADIDAVISDALNTGKEVMPSEPTGSAGGPRNTAPAGLSAGGGAEPAVQPDAATVKGVAFEIAVNMELHAAMGTTTKAKAEEIERAILAMLRKGDQP